MQRVSPVINLAAAQGSLSTWMRPPIYQPCQQSTDAWVPQKREGETFIFSRVDKYGLPKHTVSMKFHDI